MDSEDVLDAPTMQEKGRSAATEGRRRGKRKSFKEELAELTAADPDFHDYLKSEEADLLEMDDEEDDSACSDGNGEESPSDAEGADKLTLVGVMMNGDRVVVARDHATGRGLVNADVIDFLRTVLRASDQHTRGQLKAAIETGVKCFHACLEWQHCTELRAKSHKRHSADSSQFVVKSEKVFNAVVQLSTRHMPECLLTLLRPMGVRNGSKLNGDLKAATRFKNWRKHSGLVKKYLEIYVNLLPELCDREATLKAIRHTRHAVGLFVRFKKLCKELIKALARCWGQPEESARKASHVTLLKIAGSSEEMYPVVYNAFYRVYMSNTKLVDTETLPLLAYMRRTLANSRMTLINPAESHRLASLHIRRLAIRLRSAVIAKKKDLVKTVYNWQYLQALRLWTTVVTKGRRDCAQPSPFDDLLQPLVEIINILRRLFISPRHMPFRMHCVRLLLEVQRNNDDVFIPTLAAAIELFDDLAAIDEKRPAHSKDAPRLKPIDELISLKSAQLEDVNFRHLLATELCQLVMESSEAVRDNPAYSSMLLPLDERLKKFVKSCHNPAHVQMVKELRKKLRAEQVPNKHTVTAGKTRKRSRRSSDLDGR